MVCGVALKWLLGVLGMGQQYIDRETAGRIGGTATDWLVAFGLATLRLDVVWTYLGPIVALCLAGWATCLAYLFVVAPRVHDDHWFERGIFAFGWTTGVVAMGIALLRIVDPNGESKTLSSYALAYVLIAPIELALIAALPVIVLTGYLWIAGAALLVLAALVAGARLRWESGSAVAPDPDPR